MARPHKGDRILTAFRLRPTEKQAVVDRARLLGLTHSEYVSQLVNRDQVDAAGLPLWADELSRPDELPLAM